METEAGSSQRPAIIEGPGQRNGSPRLVWSAGNDFDNDYKLVMYPPVLDALAWTFPETLAPAAESDLNNSIRPASETAQYHRCPPFSLQYSAP